VVDQQTIHMTLASLLLASARIPSLSSSYPPSLLLFRLHVTCTRSSFYSGGGKDRSLLEGAMLSVRQVCPRNLMGVSLSLFLSVGRWCRAVECCEDSLPCSPRQTPRRIISIRRKLVAKRYQFVFSACPSVEFRYSSKNLSPFSLPGQKSFGCHRDRKR